jgi:hypothetical protein
MSRLELCAVMAAAGSPEQSDRSLEGAKRTGRPPYGYPAAQAIELGDRLSDVKAWSSRS